VYKLSYLLTYLIHKHQETQLSTIQHSRSSSTTINRSIWCSSDSDHLDLAVSFHLALWIADYSSSTIHQITFHCTISPVQNYTAQWCSSSTPIRN